MPAHDGDPERWILFAAMVVLGMVAIVVGMTTHDKSVMYWVYLSSIIAQEPLIDLTADPE